MAVDEVSVAPSPRGAIAEPDTSDCVPVAGSVTTLVTVQENDALAE